MNKLKSFFYDLTHSLLCFVGYHRLIHWCQNSDLCPSDAIKEEFGFEDTSLCDMECWCGKKVGGTWNE